jgi:hypothetical protein
MAMFMVCFNIFARVSCPEHRAAAAANRDSETSVTEIAANNIGIGLIVQRSDRHVGMLPASRSKSYCRHATAEATVERGSPNYCWGLLP